MTASTMSGSTGSQLATGPTRTRRDRCPGLTRPWLADDGALVRVRLPGGHIQAHRLAALSAVARTFGDGDLHLTARANLQLRALPHEDRRLRPDVRDAIVATGLVPSPAHDLVRNIMASPLTGRRGGRADLRPVIARLDALLLDDVRMASLPGRFLFVLDDGRGDLTDRGADLGLIALDADVAQLRIGATYGDVVTLDAAPGALLALAHRFLDVRGTGPGAVWHVRELREPLVASSVADPRALVAMDPRRGPVELGAEHVAVPGGVLDPDLVARLTAHPGELVVTPWHGVLLPEFGEPTGHSTSTGPGRARG